MFGDDGQVGGPVGLKTFLPNQEFSGSFRGSAVEYLSKQPTSIVKRPAILGLELERTFIQLTTPFYWFDCVPAGTEIFADAKVGDDIQRNPLLRRLCDLFGHIRALNDKIICL